MNFWTSKQLIMNYLRINKSLIIIKGNNLFYIFILNNIFEHKF
jgi:hypothetical protein